MTEIKCSKEHVTQANTRRMTDHQKDNSEMTLCKPAKAGDTGQTLESVCSLYLLQKLKQMLIMFLTSGITYTNLALSTTKNGRLSYFKHSTNKKTENAYRVSSILALDLPYLIKSVACWARPNQLVFPASPRQIAHTIVDFPVPFGPMITFRWGPHMNSTLSYVLQCVMKHITNYVTSQISETACS